MSKPTCPRKKSHGDSPKINVLISYAIVWGNSETPLAQEITTRLRTLGFNVPDPTMHRGSRYGNYTNRVEIRYTTRGQAKIPLILQELERIPELTTESRLFTASEGLTFSLAGDIQIQFPIILP